MWQKTLKKGGGEPRSESGKRREKKKKRKSKTNPWFKPKSLEKGCKTSVQCGRGGKKKKNLAKRE